MGKLKIYGLWANDRGFDCPENWEKSQTSVQNLENKIPMHGISIFGKVHSVYQYYLCMFSYVCMIVTPPNNLIRRLYKSIARYIWYPTRVSVIKKDVLTLCPSDGGVGFPDLEIRTKVNRIMFYVRILNNKEELSWRRCFYHFFTQVQFLSKHQLRNVEIPDFYKEIRMSLIDIDFHRIGDFVWVF